MKVFKKSITVPGGGVNSLEDRVLQNSLVVDLNYESNNNALIFDVADKLKITFSSTDITVGMGKALIDGCIFDNDVITTIIPARPTSGTAKGYICMTVDLSGTTGEKQYFEDILGDSVTFPILVQDSLLEVSGVVKQIPIASFEIDSNGFVTNGVDLTPEIIKSDKQPVYFVDGNQPDENGHVESIIKTPRLTPGVDLNTITTIGFYHSPANADACLNVPIANTAFSLLVEKHAGIKQTWTQFMATSPVRTFVRNYYSNVWSEWNEVIMENSWVNKTEWSFDELGLDNDNFGSVHKDNVKIAYDAVVAKIGTDKKFTIRQSLYNDVSESRYYDFCQALDNELNTEYGRRITSTVFTFEITFELFRGSTSINNNMGKWMIVRSNNDYFQRIFDYDNYTSSKWLDEKHAPHADLVCETRSFMQDIQGININTPHRNYISGITFWVADYNNETDEWGTSDGNIRYVPRCTPATPPTTLSTGDGDSLFAPYHAMLSSIASANNPITSLNELANTTFNVHYANSEHTYPNGILIEGGLISPNQDQVLAMVIIHYGAIEWGMAGHRLKYASKASYTPTVLAEFMDTKIMTPNSEQEAGTND